MENPGNPLERTYSGLSTKFVSTVTYSIAGILCTVHGLDELPVDVQELACLWLLHPRLQDQSSMAPIASQAIHHWNSRQRERAKPHGLGPKTKGLIAVSFDHRNHGRRKVDDVANEAWKNGNKRHAQDMFGIYQGTASDTSLLLRHLGSYLPPTLSTLPTAHHALGISLGGHSAWQLVTHDPLIRTAIIIIGCPDYTRLMLHRAERSRLPSFTLRHGDREAASRSFLRSADFPHALADEVRRTDPAALLLPAYLRAPNDGAAPVLVSDHSRLAAALDATLKGKTVALLSGGADKLVPYSVGEVFYRFLKGAVGAGGGEGWWRGNGFTFVDRVYNGVGHETSPAMAVDAVSLFADAALEGKVESRM